MSEKYYFMVISEEEEEIIKFMKIRWLFYSYTTD
jgi:hypothetical protein